MKGKEKCKILKQIRQKIADQNHIAFVTSECKHRGDCLGTCPKCEQELRQLERELEKRQKAGKTIAIAGIAAALMVASVGCGSTEAPAATQTVQPSATMETATAGVPEDYTTLGLMDYTATEPDSTELMGEPTEPLPTGAICVDSTETTVKPLMGDVAFEDTQP